MSPFLITGVAAGVLGLAIGGASIHALDANHYGALLSAEKAARATDIAKINAESAKQLQDALTRQQATEGRVATIEQQFNEEVSKHASDVLDYRAQLASGAQRMRVRVVSCNPAGGSGQSAAAPSSPDASAPSADLAPAVATGLVTVASDDQKEIDKLAALQKYVETLQQQGFIGK